MGLLTRLTGSSEPADESRGRPLPGPGGVPVLGASVQLGKFPKIWDGFSEYSEKYGSLVGVQIGSRYCLLVNSAECIREILVNKANQFANRPDFLRFHAIFRWNRHLSVALCDWSAKQRTRRDLLYGPLHPRNGACQQTKLFKAISSQTSALMTELKSKAGVALEPRRLILYAVGNVFYDFFCSTTFDWSDKTYQHIVELYNEVFHELFKGFAIDVMPWLKPFYQKRLNELNSMAGEISQFTSRMIEEHEHSLDGHEEDPRDITDILLLYLRNHAAANKSNEGTLDQIDVDVIVEDLIGGFPVVSNLFLWAIWIIAGEPAVQDKLYEEYMSVNGSGVCDSEHKKSLVYAEGAMYELMRVVCSPIIPHVAVEDTTLKGYHVPKDTMVMFNTCDLNFNPDHWEEPKKFRPERFIRDGMVQKPDFFFPFGTGKRACMGDGIVRHVVHLMLSTLFGHFRVRLAPGTAPLNYIEARGKVIMDSEPHFVFEPRQS